MITPTDPNVQKLHAWIESHEDEIVAALQGVLRIPSVEAPPAGPGAPFGQPVREALDYSLALCERMGFKTKNVDGFAGHAEMGEGTEMIAALGHLDVVPEGDRWVHEPYGAALEDGYLYARGSADDKGPTYAALFAAKAIMECGLPLSRRIRIIFGCNEESGFACVEHYFNVAKEERPTYAFTPDAGFPLIYAEKGIADLVFEKELPTGELPLRITNAGGGRRPNMVPDYAEATVQGTPEAVADAAETLAKFWDRNVTFERIGGGIVVKAVGKSAHGARPAGGDNAVARLARALGTLNLPEKSVCAWTGSRRWSRRPARRWGSPTRTMSRDRLPATWAFWRRRRTTRSRSRSTSGIRSPGVWRNCWRPIARSARRPAGRSPHTRNQPPLYVPLDQEPVATLLRVYQEETGDLESKPRTMGGGTYARATPNAVAYGAGFPGSSDGPAHEPDERIAVSTVLNAAKIYAHAFYELAK